MVHSGMGRTGASLTTGRTRLPVALLTSAERVMHRYRKLVSLRDQVGSVPLVW